MSETRAQYGEAEPLLREALRIAAETVNFARPADLRRILLEAADDNERLRAALRPFAREADDWEESTDDDFYPAIGESGDGAWSTAPATFTVGDLRRARAALNHAAPAAEQEGE